MKKNALVIIPALICGMMFAGCDSDKGELMEMVISGIEIKTYNEIMNTSFAEIMMKRTDEE